MKSPWETYETMDFSEMDEIRAERAFKEAHPFPKQSLFKRVVGKFTDE
jgi:hypothetical protein